MSASSDTSWPLAGVRWQSRNISILASVRENSAVYILKCTVWIWSVQFEFEVYNLNFELYNLNLKCTTWILNCTIWISTFWRSTIRQKTKHREFDLPIKSEKSRKQGDQFLWGYHPKSSQTHTLSNVMSKLFVENGVAIFSWYNIPNRGKNIYQMAI
jgi:hypothetical protein